ncbi:hypothetical protein CH063_09357 [Colletotrichum higginsianum]|uniref:Uncharacterized protein n=2 Tax=Colletotrichum destructivum species complex TaxID=2707350 RepID=H1VDA6_COLHI|nr:hypothetical protein CH063_09357 [Colletotrichum higginsianum]
MRGFSIVASALCASYVAAQGAVCFDDLDCALTGQANAKCVRAQAGGITG